MDIAPDLLRIRDPSDGLKIHRERKACYGSNALRVSKATFQPGIPSHVYPDRPFNTVNKFNRYFRTPAERRLRARYKQDPPRRASGAMAL